MLVSEPGGRFSVSIVSISQKVSKESKAHHSGPIGQSAATARSPNIKILAAQPHDLTWQGEFEGRVGGPSSSLASSTTVLLSEAVEPLILGLEVGEEVVRP